MQSLRTRQEAAAKAQRWQVVDSQRAMDGRALCAGSLECERLGKDCPLADRVRWNFPKLEGVMTPQDQTWSQFSDFVPYDDSRMRGIRYANDALLTSARLSGDKKRVRLDWLAGLAHPTAAVHARIAALVAASSAVGHTR